MNNEPKPVLRAEELACPSEPVVSNGQPETARACKKTRWAAEKVTACIVHIAQQGLNPVQEEDLLNNLKEESGYSLGTLRETLQQAKGQAKQKDGAGNPKPDIESLFTLEEKEAAAKLSEEKNLFPVFARLVNQVGYLTDRIHTDGMLLTVGLSNLPIVTYVCYTGDTSDGKTFAAETANAFVDFQQRVGKVLAIIDCSKNWLKYGAGTDGRALQNKILFLDEMNPAKQGEDDYRQSLMRQMDSERTDYVECRIVDELGERILPIWKPIHFVFTSITPGHRWDLQNRNRTYYLEFNHDNFSVKQVMHRIADEQKLPREQALLGNIATEEEKQFIFRTFNYFLCKYTGIDRDGRLITGVKVPFLERLIPSSDDACGSDIRRLKMLRNAIHASALLHSHHRHTEQDEHGNNWLIAEKADFENIKDAFECMVPRVTKPAGKAYLATFRKIALALYNHPGGQNKKWLRPTCKLSKKAAEEHLNDLCEVELLELVPATQPNDRQHYYKLGPKFSEHFNRVTTEDQNLGEQAAIIQAVDFAIAEIEMDHQVVDSPRTSKHLDTEARHLERPTSEAIEHAPCHLAGGNGRGNTKAILDGKT
jgi:hypothetical protein